MNHKGDSDSTGAVTGNILGAINGYAAMEEKWKTNLECRNVLLEIADDLYRIQDLTESAPGSVWERKYGLTL